MMPDRTGETYVGRYDTKRRGRTFSVVSSIPDERVNVRAGFVHAWIHSCVCTRENGEVALVEVKEDHLTLWDDLFAGASDP
jgi:hypothetical protein